MKKSYAVDIVIKWFKINLSSFYIFLLFLVEIKLICFRY